MRFSSRIVVAAAIPALFFAISVVSAIVSLSSTQKAFETYLNTEQAIERNLSEMYAQGLQMGQALRNIVLDPANGKAYENLKAAQTAYDKASTQVQDSAQGTPLVNLLPKLKALRLTQAASQEKIIALVKAKGDAIAILNAEETPAWRLLRAELLQARENATANAQTAYQQVRAQAERGRNLAMLLAVVATLVASFLTWRLQRTIKNELGGDPADARLALSHIAHGDLDKPVSNSGGEHSLMAMMQKTQDALQLLVRDVRQSAGDIAQATSEIAAGSQDLSNRTEQTAANLEEAAASIAQLTSTVQLSSDSSQQASTLAGSAAGLAARSGSVVAEVVATMGDINHSSRQIADIISVIDGIAFQTNILALNAAVEAARAGEQGRGFAVVASEVRALAGRSADAAKEITRLITASEERVEKGVALVEQAGTAIAELVKSVEQVAQVIGEVCTTSSEQNADILQVNASVMQVDDMTQRNAALVEQSAAASANLSEQARRLTEAISRFHTAS